ncbi:MAG: O-antigen polymerase [Candidatus Sulfotelmatobacter sp.]
MAPISKVQEHKVSRLRGLRLPRRTLIHPLVIFWGAWIIAGVLYIVHLSDVLIFSGSIVIDVVAWIVIPFTLAALVYLGFYSWAPSSLSAFRLDTEFRVALLTRRLYIAFIIWAILTSVEIVVSGGVPLLWLIQGSSKSYFDFGIASFHGFLNSLILTIGLTGFAIFAMTGKKKHLWMPGFVVLWSLIAVTRNMMIVILIECGIVWVMVRGISSKTLSKGIFGLAALMLVFGYIGDVRTGVEQFQELAEPSSNYPNWLPSGVLWGYIYVSTPLNNLINTTRSAHPLNSPLFPYTTSQLVPSALRDKIYPQEIVGAAGGELVEESWNVSTAFVGAFQDFGMLGIACYAMFMALIAAHFWRDRSLRGSLVYAVVGQCLAISIFFNHLFYLPVITQVVWLYVLLRQPRRSRPAVAGTNLSVKL